MLELSVLVEEVQAGFRCLEEAVASDAAKL